MNRLSLRNIILISLILGIITSIYVYFKKTPTKLKQEEKNLSLKNQLYLYINRIIHYGVSIYFRLYPFLGQLSIFNDFLYIFFFLVVIIQWYIFSECTLSIAEKQLLNPNYVAGSNVNYEPYLYLIFNDHSILYLIWKGSFIFSIIFILIHLLYFHNYQELIKFKKYTPLKHL